MRLGGPLFQPYTDPDAWIAALKAKQYGAAPCPVGPDADDEAIEAFADAAEAAGIVIAEVGAFGPNPLSPHADIRRAAIAATQQRLLLAEKIGARCCVNIAGSRSDDRETPGLWDSPHPDNLSQETFELIVETVREIIDGVMPKRTCYSLEPMPWVLPDSPETYLRLIEAIDRPNQFAVHLDPVNLVTSPRLAFHSAELIERCFKLLGPHIRACHAKDIAIEHKLTVHMNEVRPGLGLLDYKALLRGIESLGPDTPLILEHLPTEAEYDKASLYIRSVAAELGVAIKG